MHTFKDIEGEEWSIVLDVNMTRKIRSELGVDLHAMDEESITKLFSDDESLVDVVSVICTEQINKRELDASGFASRLIGSVLDDACDALIDEVVFISRRNRSQVVAKAWEKTKAAESLAVAKAMEYLDSGAIEKEVEKAMATLHGGDS